MAKYKVKNTCILHNKKLYLDGDTLELSDNEAKRLAEYIEIVETKNSTKNTVNNKSKASEENDGKQTV